MEVVKEGDLGVEEGGASVSLYLLLYTFFYQHRDLCVGLFGVLWILLLLGVCQVSSQIGLDT